MSIVEYTEFLVKNLVKDPELVKVESFPSDDESLIVEIIVPDDEMKLVIGRNGNNAKALRTLIQAFAYIHDMKKVKIKIDAY